MISLRNCTARRGNPRPASFWTDFYNGTITVVVSLLTLIRTLSPPCSDQLGLTETLLSICVGSQCAPLGLPARLTGLEPATSTVTG